MILGYIFSLCFIAAAMLMFVIDCGIVHVPLTRRDSIIKLLRHANVTYSNSLRRRRGIHAPGDNVALHDYGNAEYFAPLGLGTPTQWFEVIYDTGSADTWVPQKGCTPCSGKKTYDHTMSSTYRANGAPFSISYGSGSVTGYESMDKALLGDVIVRNHTFAETQDMSGLDIYEQSKFDGLCGLGFPAISASGATPLFIQAVAEGVVAEPVFCFYLGRKDGADGSIDFGGIDTSKYRSPIRRVDLLQPSYWLAALDSVTVRGQRVSNMNKFIADSGTSLLIGPSADVENIAKAFGNLSTDQGLYTAPCAQLSSLPDLVWVIGGHSYAISATDLSIDTDGAGNCYLGFAPGSEELWILGDVFMRKFYTIFDVGNKQLGFAEAI